MDNRKQSVFFAMLAIAAGPCLAADRTPIEGTWRLVSFEREYQAAGEREYPMGRIPTGYIFFLPEGRMAVVITADGRKAPSTDQDRAELYGSLVAYTGKYRLEGDKWVTTVDVAANPAWVGTEQARAFRVTGDRLQETTAWFTRPDNRMARAVITYERANAGVDAMRTLLLRPAGWKFAWKSLSGEQGEEAIAFEARGDKLVAKITSASKLTNCEREVILAPDAVTFDRCRGKPANAFRFDSQDRDYPFKGTREDGVEIRMRAKSPGS